MRKVRMGGYFLLANLLLLTVVSLSPSFATTQTADSPTAPVSSFATSIAQAMSTVDIFWQTNKETSKAFSASVATIRESPWLPIVGAVLFVTFALPRSLQNARDYFDAVMRKDPLPAFRKGGVTDEMIKTARKALFFFTLFLLYQIFQFPLTFGNDDLLPFSADLFFQTTILILMIHELAKLKRALNTKWQGDPDRGAYMKAWLDTKLDGIQISWRHIRKLAVGIYIAGFGPVALSNSFVWLDALAALNSYALTLLASA